MNHEPYLTWLLSDDPIPSENLKELNDHLQSCPNCRLIRDSWIDVEDFIRSIPSIDPEPGFVYRWHDHLAIDRLEEQVFRHRWQSLITLVGIANVLVILSIALGLGLVSIYDTPAQLILIWTSRLTSLISFVNTAQELGITLLNSILTLIPNEVWMAYAAFLGVIGLFWIITIRKYTLLQRRA
jgi:hypothetical protein